MLAKRTTSRKSGGAAFTLAAGLSPRRPLALRPAVTGGLPFSRVLAITEAKTVPCCIACHSNSKSSDLYDLVSPSPDTHIANRGASQVLQSIDICPRRRRQIRESPY